MAHTSGNFLVPPSSCLCNHGQDGHHQGQSRKEKVRDGNQKLELLVSCHVLLLNLGMRRRKRRKLCEVSFLFLGSGTDLAQRERGINWIVEVVAKRGSHVRSAIH